MFRKVYLIKTVLLFLLLLCVLKVSCMSVLPEDYNDKKDVVVFGDSLFSSYYTIDWHPHSDEDVSEPDKSDEDESSEDIDETFDSWSLVWYIASFGGLVAFFLLIACSEWCCKRRLRDQQSTTGLASPAPSLNSETPPPAYDLFAPPSYDSLNAAGTSEKSEYDVYVVPVHAIGSLVEENRQNEEDPPSYNSVSRQQSEISASNV